MTHGERDFVSAIIIGRNEGARLIKCIRSVKTLMLAGTVKEVIYVDSDSTDGSTEIAETLGAKVLEVDSTAPTAARARNIGWQAAQGAYILFLDGDTIVDASFVDNALREFDNPSVAVVWGVRKEINASGSVYNRVLDLDWYHPPGDSAHCGGDALVRRSALEVVKGFDDDLIAGEEPDMCRCLRGAGYRIVHIDVPMTSHDLGITNFKGYWKRNFRTGYAYAEISRRYKDSSDPLWLREYRTNWLRGGLWLLLGLWSVAALLFQHSLVPMLLVLLLVVVLSLRTAWKIRDRGHPFSTSFLYGLHSHLSKIPMLFGQLAFHLDRRRRRSRPIIEYK